jgi:hypothetical protein
MHFLVFMAAFAFALTLGQAVAFFMAFIAFMAALACGARPAGFFIAAIAFMAAIAANRRTNKEALHYDAKQSRARAASKQQRVNMMCLQAYCDAVVVDSFSKVNTVSQIDFLNFGT